MESSDDEAEAVPQTVSNYHFGDEKEEPISFHVLPIQWSESESERQDEKKVQIYLHGYADNGLEKICKPVVAWKFDLSNVKPEISVLLKVNRWMVLQKPRKSYEGIIRSILITVQCLSYAKRNPEISSKSMWDHLSKAFSLYEVRPSLNDLVDHTPLINEAVKRDRAFANSKFIVEFLEEKPTKRKLSDEDLQATTKPGFIVDDSEDYMIDVEDDSNDDDENLFDSVCAFCDNGGELLCCEGRCLRSFHATVEDGGDSSCESLGFTREEVNAMPNFFCKNCQYKQHQCFACGKLGSSDKLLGAEVFPCVSATCGQFYHPRCVTKLIYQDNGVSAEELEKKISLGESFTCPIHKCCVCKQGENKKDPELRFAVCRRCPKSYHRKCLPSEIRFEKTEEDGEEEIEDEEIETRAWEGLLPNRILIYCTEHEIDEEIGTPIRDHVKFPDVDEKKITVVKKKTIFEEKKRRQTSESLVVRDSSVSKKRKLSSEGLYRGRTAPTISKQKMTSVAKVGGSGTNEKVPFGLDASRKGMVKNTLRKEVQISVEKTTSLDNRLFAYLKGSGSVKFGKQDTSDSEFKSEKTAKVDPTSKTVSSPPAYLDPAREKRLCALMKDAASSVTLEEVIRKHKVPSTHASSNRYAVDRNITLGKVEGSIEAVRTALRKLQEGCSTEDAEAVCAPEILHQIYKWKNKLSVYLAPFCMECGTHPSVAILRRWENWKRLLIDSIGTYRMGTRIIMKKKLEETGKKCYYKNYDIIQPKNDFCFEKRDWMTVQPKELPASAQLIMGLNPPFGVKASLANQFINKALQFNPKLLILIVPPEAQRLSAYDLIWEDERFLSGKSFYLPGSVDENDKQMDQWNVTAPPLYLWSRPPYSALHKAIAQKHGHINMSPKTMEDGHSESLHNSVENNYQYGETPMMIDDNPAETSSSKDFVGGAVASEEPKERSSKANDERGYRARLQCGDRKEHGRGLVELSPDNTHDGGNGSGSEIHKERSPSTEREGKGNQHSEPSNSGSSMQFGTAYGGTAASIPDDTGRRFVMSSDEPYSSVTHRWSSGASPRSSYRDTNLEEPVMGYMRERSNTFSYRPYSMEMEHPFRRESDIRAQVCHYGQQDSDPYRRNYLVGQDSVCGQVGSFSSTYGQAHLGSAVGSTYRMNTSALQRYAPRLDELNHTRTSALGSQPTLGYDPRMYCSNMYHPRAPPPGDQGGPFGFAPASHQSFSNQNSAGWLNE